MLPRWSEIPSRQKLGFGVIMMLCAPLALLALFLVGAAIGLGLAGDGPGHVPEVINILGDGLAIIPFVMFILGLALTIDGLADRMGRRK